MQIPVQASSNSEYRGAVGTSAEAPDTALYSLLAVVHILARAAARERLDQLRGIGTEERTDREGVSDVLRPQDARKHEPA